jgi:hypothetical protein
MVPLYVFLSLLGLGYYVHEQDSRPVTKQNLKTKSPVPVKIQIPKRSDINKATGTVYQHRRNLSSYVGNTDNRKENSDLTGNTIEGFNGTAAKESFVETLTGEYIPKKEFQHNNMQPFFKSASYGDSFKENSISSERLGIYTGRDPYKKDKSSRTSRDLNPIFKPNENKQTTWGMPDTTGERMKHYNQSMYVTNELPFEKTYVGPGLNDGYTAKPSGGFHNEAALEAAMPPSVDELRTLNNPKLTFEGRVKSGAGPQQRGKVGSVGKYKPSKFYLNTPDRYFTTVGGNERESNRPTQVLKRTDRGKQRDYLQGPAKFQTPKNPNRTLTRKSAKITFKTDGARNMDGRNYWNADDDFTNYGKNGINLPATEREVTGKRTSIRNLSTVFKKPQAFDPTDVLPTTIKETLIHDEREGNVGRMPDKRGGYIVAPKYARTTRKETTLTDYTGDPSIDQLGGRGGYLTAPTDLRYTNKENISVGRAPTQVKEALAVGSDKINVQINKLENDQIVTREPQTTKIYNSIEQPERCGITVEKDRLDDARLMAERVDPNLLDAFRKNPYTQSLSSYSAP